MWIRKGHKGTRNLFQCGSNKQGEDQEKKVLCSKTSTKKGLQFENFHKLWQGCRNKGEMGKIYPPNNLAVSPPIIWMGVQYIWAKIGEKSVLFLKKIFFFFLVFTWIWVKKVFYFSRRPFFWSSSEFGWKKCSICIFFWSSFNFQTWTKSWSRFIPPTLKIGQNWDKIANPPNAQQRSAPLNSGCRLKILAIFHEFLREDQKKKKKGLRPKSCIKSGVGPQKLRKYERKTPIWESRFALQ